MSSRQSNRLRNLTSAALCYEAGVRGNTCFENGQYDQAMKCYTEVLRKAGEGNQRHIAARALLNIGNVFFRKGDTSKSFQAFAVALRLAKSLLASDQHNQKTSISTNSATNYSIGSSGSGGSSVGTCRSESDTSTTIYLSLVADSLHNIAAIQMQRELYEEALAHYSEALLLRRQCLEYTSSAGESKSFEERSMKKDKNNVHDYKSDDASHDDDDHDGIDDNGNVDRILLEISEALNHIGMCSEKVGKYEDALAAYEESIKIRTSILGPMHLLVAESYLNLGGCYSDIANYAAATDHYNKSLSIRISELGKHHPEVSDTLNLIAILHLRQDRLNEALTTCTQAIEAAVTAQHPSSSGASTILPVEPLTIANAVNTMGMIMEKLGFLDSALHNYTESLKIKTKLLGGKASTVASTLHNIGNIYFHNEDYDSAMMAYMEALEIMDAPKQHGDVKSVTTWNNIGLTYTDQKKYDDAVTYHTRALKALKESSRRVDKFMIAETYNYLGLALKGKGKLEEANENFSRALDIYKRDSSGSGGVNCQTIPQPYSEAVALTDAYHSPAVVLDTSDDEGTI
jgi:tetratricopeptide (TPR) repeat protein